jgi:hypothetical protein
MLPYSVFYVIFTIEKLALGSKEGLHTKYECFSEKYRFFFKKRLRFHGFLLILYPQCACTYLFLSNLQNP